MPTMLDFVLYKLEILFQVVQWLCNMLSSNTSASFLKKNHAWLSAWFPTKPSFNLWCEPASATMVQSGVVHAGG